MKATGVVRKIDELGRIVLPKELRDTMELPEGTPMEVFTDAGSIILREYNPGCVFCGSMAGIEDFKGKDVCKHCREDIRKGLR